ncbi:ABC transporter permease [uncultured Desulfuromusa sp.]|uniref:ABC transporter permease n=1 Tax=uncultured Desulfuromusa sp. TaxID=219183 RepID=UPI002AA6E30F|nr:ABC transporter permease [uncultured Desulfuromusa sp.]
MKHLFNLTFILLSVLVLLFIVIPLVGLFSGVGWDGLRGAFLDSEIMLSVWLTMRVSFLGTCLILLTGLPLAYLIARNDFKGKSIIESIIDIPVMIPHTAAGIALLMAFNQGGMQRFFKSMGIQFIDTEAGIMIAMMFLSSPFLINGAKEGFKNVDPKLENVARTLGAGRFSAFFRVVLPNAQKDIVNGMLMMWSRGLGEFGAVVIIAYHPMVAPVMIYDRFNSYGLSYSAPVAAVMIAVSLTTFLLVRGLNNRKLR